MLLVPVCWTCCLRQAEFVRFFSLLSWQHQQRLCCATCVFCCCWVRVLAYRVSCRVSGIRVLFQDVLVTPAGGCNQYGGWMTDESKSFLNESKSLSFRCVGRARPPFPLCSPSASDGTKQQSTRTRNPSESTWKISVGSIRLLFQKRFNEVGMEVPKKVCKSA